ncbi:ABC transporter related protein [Xylanimonas cellulosilytica DSM 15894]|uniref:ABC transporter related protein n=1 Tax=Xylanimonas cellulosilytica (strain DSM 15894 / JCM 12276 / CECT 5975 / KCTC 9989 / LMG 20990 / NBRC 107835 / XIL07) TaxID=446471 RepID=D1BTK8_XYLCX|nr:ABC transporter ATP-binding protein [Xylanimonas cellulosilytica]ACZ30987.1 ABC transporter related protein [Xylanimonas cellulosilytica DSM 15894]
MSDTQPPEASDQIPEQTPEKAPVGDLLKPARMAVLLRFLKPHWRVITLGAAIGMIATVATLWTPRVVQDVIDAVMYGTPVAGYVTTLAILTVVGIIASWLSWIVLGRTAETVVFDVRRSLVERFVRGRVLQVAARPAGELVSRTTSDSQLLSAAVSSGFVSLVNGATGIIGTVILMGVIDPVMLAIALGAVVIFGGIMAALMPAVGRHRARAQEAIGHMGGELEGSVRALRTVKVARAERRRISEVLTHAADARRHGIKAVRSEAIAWTFAFGGIQVAIVVIVALGAWRVSAGYLSIAALVAFLMYIFNFIGPVMEFAEALSSLQSGLAASKRIIEIEEIDTEAVDDAPRSIAPSPSAGPASGTTAPRPVLEFDDVTARYTDDGEDVVQNLSIAIPRTGHTAFVGPSGAGKTSALSLALRFLEPTSGEIRIDGVPFQELTPAQVRSRFAFVEQDTPVIPGTIRDNLLIANPDATEEAIVDVLDVVQLTDQIAALPDGLDTSLVSSSVSGGQRQRIALARALLAQADVLLLDEATSQLDGRTESAIHSAITAAAQHGAVITVAHRLSTVVDADRIVVMDEGRVRAMGTHAELLATDSLYAEFVEALTIDRPAAPRTLAPA